MVSNVQCAVWCYGIWCLCECLCLWSTNPADFSEVLTNKAINLLAFCQSWLYRPVWHCLSQRRSRGQRWSSEYHCAVAGLFILWQSLSIPYRYKTLFFSSIEFTKFYTLNIKETSILLLKWVFLCKWSTKWKQTAWTGSSVTVCWNITVESPHIGRVWSVLINMSVCGSLSSSVTEHTRGGRAACSCTALMLPCRSWHVVVLWLAKRSPFTSAMAYIRFSLARASLWMSLSTRNTYSSRLFHEAVMLALQRWRDGNVQNCGRSYGFHHGCLNIRCFFASESCYLSLFYVLLMVFSAVNIYRKTDFYKLLFRAHIKLWGNASCC